MPALMTLLDSGKTNTSMGLVNCSEHQAPAHVTPNNPMLGFLVAHFCSHGSWMMRVTATISPATKNGVIASAITEMLAIAR
jgi:hypothetical protein